uniref:Uncharacterized protein n=1 Tax=Pediastrum duplex TaxID=3105 RepID=A0A2U8GID9_PEDDU|nr:hypothetical protein [Pediastrum duplex]AWI68349.1 hypothetical protein [Pediastrum duplex]
MRSSPRFGASASFASASVAQAHRAERRRFGFADARPRNRTEACRLFAPSVLRLRFFGFFGSQSEKPTRKRFGEAEEPTRFGSQSEKPMRTDARRRSEEPRNQRRRTEEEEPKKNQRHPPNEPQKKKTTKLKLKIY